MKIQKQFFSLIHAICPSNLAHVPDMHGTILSLYASMYFTLTHYKQFIIETYMVLSCRSDIGHINIIVIFGQSYSLRTFYPDTVIERFIMYHWILAGYLAMTHLHD